MRERFLKKFDGAFLFVYFEEAEFYVNFRKQVHAELMILAVAIRLFINV